jgi:hypothetical protein
MNQLSPAPRVRRPIAGYVGIGGLIQVPAEFFGPHWVEEVELSPGSYEPYRIFKIRGGENFPPYSDGELLFVPEQPGTLRHHIGRDCVVRTGDGSMFLRMLTLGTRNGHFTLLSVNAAPLIDVLVTWASPVEWTAPGESSAMWAARAPSSEPLS